MPPTAENLQSIEKYTRRAAGYDATTGRTWPIRERCIALMGLRSGETALDVGCGTGLSFELLARAVDTSGRVLAFEQSAAMHEHAAARAQALLTRGPVIRVRPAVRLRCGEAALRGELCLWTIRRQPLQQAPST